MFCHHVVGVKMFFLTFNFLCAFFGVLTFTIYLKLIFFTFFYFSLNANLAANAANSTTNARWNRLTRPDEFIKYVRIALANMKLAYIQS